jgi:hypothetical protein
MKEHLATALKLNDKGDLNWIKHIKTIVDSRNAELIPGTSMVRSEVTKETYMRLLKALFRSNDPTALFNTATMGDENFAPWLSRKLWRFPIQSKVLLARDANYKLKKDFFGKKSVLGAYDEKIYTVASRQLKSNKSFFLSAVYELAEIPGSKFYESELIPAYFSG